jgi:hypothetical protein
MVLGEWDSRVSQGLSRAISVKPCRSNEPVYPASDHALNQDSACRDPLSRLISRETQELAFPRGHETSPEPVGARFVTSLVAVIIAVEEHLDAGVGPASKSRREGRTWHNWRVAPMVWNDQHCQAAPDMFAEHIDKLIDFGFEAR